MKNIFYTCTLLILHFNLFSQDSFYVDKKHREYYIKDISEKCILGLFALKNFNTISLTNDYNNKTISYQPNDYLIQGINFRLNWLKVSIAFSSNGLQGKKQVKTDFTNIKFNVFIKKFNVELFYLNYTGFYILNEDNSVLPSKGNYLRPDLKTLNTGANFFYVFNNKYSYKNSIIHTEIQKHSRGSFILNASANYYSIYANSSIIPKSIDSKAYTDEIKLKNGDFYNFSILPGYAHTFVVKKYFFIGFQAFAGVNFQKQHYLSDINKGLTRYDDFNIIPRTFARLNFGYNSESFFTGFTSILDNYYIPLGLKERINYNNSNYIIYVGYHFNIHKKIKKYTDYMNFKKNK